MQRLFTIAFASFTLITSAQTHFASDTVGSGSASENIYNKALFGDSLCSSFCIVIKKEVKLHKHLYHSEQVVVMEGEGVMKLDGNTFAIKKGDVVFIPRNSAYSVRSTGAVPLKVISVQSPKFDGTDRVFVEEK